ncbi:MAG: hypothetical protein INQ03_11940 [Candidatus Heimdallarchaeota archaeon]|nr:hypothetical protein [Candidatus Heimdallarchaeota archaeon]
MSFNDESAKAVSDGDIGVGFLIDGNGTQYWSVGTWEGFDPLFVLQEWQKSGMNPIVVGNLRFTVIGKAPEKLVTTNVGGNGHLIGAKCDNWQGGFLICWCPNTLRPDIAYTVVKKLADLVAG